MLEIDVVWVLIVVDLCGKFLSLAFYGVHVALLSCKPYLLIAFATPYGQQPFCPS